MTLKQQLGKLKCKNFLFLTIAGMVNAFGVTMFIAPVDLYDSGIIFLVLFVGYLLWMIQSAKKARASSVSSNMPNAPMETSTFLAPAL